MNKFICNENKISDLPPRIKITLGFKNDMRQNMLKSICNHFGYQPVSDIAKTNWAKISNFHRSFFLRNESLI